VKGGVGTGRWGRRGGREGGRKKKDIKKIWYEWKE